LTSLNSRLKSNVPGRRPLDRPVQTGYEKARNIDAQPEATPIDGDLDGTPSSNSNGLDIPFVPKYNSLQILDLHSHNPIVSYRKEVYSCTWADMIGSNMFFATPINQWPDSEEPLEMLGTSRVRLIGHKAKAIVKGDVTTEASASNKRIFKGTNVMPQHKNANTAMKRQADFLGRLMDAKKAKGDTDTVRVLVPRASKTSTSAGASSSAEDSARREELEKLNRRVLRGDSRALAKLQRMYGHEDESANQDALNEEQLGEEVRDVSSALPQLDDNH
jgi:hypothetical protein